MAAKPRLFPPFAARLLASGLEPVGQCASASIGPADAPPPFPHVGSFSTGLSDGSGKGTRKGSREGVTQPFAHAAIPIQMRPVRRQADHDPPRADDDFRRHLDEQGAPGAGVSFPQRVTLPPQPEVALPLRPGQRLRRHMGRGGGKRSLARRAGRRRCGLGGGSQGRQRLGDEPPQRHPVRHRARRPVSCRAALAVGLRRAAPAGGAVADQGAPRPMLQAAPLAEA